MATQWISDKPSDNKVKPNFKNEIGRFPSTSSREPTATRDTRNSLEPKYEEIYSQWRKKPDKATTAKMLSAVSVDIDRAIFASAGASNPLLRSRAKLMAVQAMKRYDPTQSALGTHIINSLQGLKRVNRQQNQIISVPERVFYDQNYLRGAETEFELDNGRTATDEELADATGLSSRRIKHVRKFHPGISEGALSVDDEDAEFSNAPAILNRRDNGAFLRVVYDDADNVDKKIMEWSFGMNGNSILPGHVIATKLRISPGAVSQRKAKIQSSLDTVMDFA